eukprot:2247019-Pleurochrysis_carterae.AAC.1
MSSSATGRLEKTSIDLRRLGTKHASLTESAPLGRVMFRAGFIASARKRGIQHRKKEGEVVEAKQRMRKGNRAKVLSRWRKTDTQSR